MDEQSVIARNVRARMAKMGIGQKALALKAGLNATYVRDILQGKSANPRQGHLAKLAGALGCRSADLTAESDADADRRLAEVVSAFDATDDRGRDLLHHLATTLKR
jgi:transcriptional regulator with XRE-family HTH domain